MVRAWLATNEIEADEPSPGLFSFSLPGEKKLQTPVRLDVGAHALGVHAFVCRNPDENHERVWRWLLEKNLRLYAVAFAVDRTGDIYLDARLPLAGVDEAELDRLLGSVLTYADESFNAILELGLRLLDPQGVGVAHRCAGSRPATSRRSAAGWRPATRRPTSPAATLAPSPPRTDLSTFTPVGYDADAGRSSSIITLDATRCVGGEDAGEREHTMSRLVLTVSS